MPIMILVTDSKGLSTFVFAGDIPDRAETTSAAQLKGWMAKAEVQHVLRMLTRSLDMNDLWISPKHAVKVQPFPVPRGDCAYEKSGNLCFYAGPRDKSSSNMMMVLSAFPSAITPRKYGKGILKMEGGRGGLVKGDVTWDVVNVTPLDDKRVRNWDTTVPKALGIREKQIF